MKKTPSARINLKVETTVSRHIAFNLIQVLVVLAFAPLASGVTSRLKEMIKSKRGPSIFQPYRDLWKLFHKDEIVSEDSSWIFRFTPYIVFVTPIFVTLLIPVLTNYPLFFTFMGDMIGGGFILALGGFFATLAAIDTANPYGPVCDQWSSELCAGSRWAWMPVMACPNCTSSPARRTKPEPFSSRKPPSI